EPTAALPSSLPAPPNAEPQALQRCSKFCCCCCGGALVRIAAEACAISDGRLASCSGAKPGAPPPVGPAPPALDESDKRFIKSVISRKVLACAPVAGWPSSCMS